MSMDKISIVVISKDETALDTTLASLEGCASQQPAEVLVVDASRGRLDDIRMAHPSVRWLDFEPPDGVRVSIPHQRNIGVAASTGDVIVFTDSGCIPVGDWLTRILRPILCEGELIVCGPTVGRGFAYDVAGRCHTKYIEECPSLNLAFRRSVFEDIGGFDESFEYGSDVDFSWRIVAGGMRIRYVEDAVIRHDWGTSLRQLRRSYAYGVARARLYRKHPKRLRRAITADPVPIVYPLFLLGLPLVRRFHAYPLLLLVPLWRNRQSHSPPLVLADHLVMGCGVLSEVSGFHRRCR